MTTIDAAAKIAQREASQPQSQSKSTGGEFVFVGLPDLNGSIRGKAFRPEAFDAVMRDGTVMTDLLLALDPTDAPITDYTRFGIRSGAGDLLVRPDASTLHELTWRPGWRICLATPSWRDGSPCELASREVLRRVVAALAELRYEALAALEYEVRIFDSDAKPLSSGLSYSFSELRRFEVFVAALVPALEALGIELSAVHTEAAPGLLELNLAARPGLRAADDATLLKMAVNGLASSMGLRASFLAKTAAAEEGSSGHIPLSCWSDGRNAFRTAPSSSSLPPVLLAAVAGVLDHLPGASLLLNPTINSYKRLVPGYFAPINASWGIDNRSCAVRAIPSSRPELCRIECRRPGADANPYLALAALIVSATEGLRRKATPPDAVVGDAYARNDLAMLPGSLESALRCFEVDETFRRALGEEFSDYFATSRRWELKAFQNTVTEWERIRYERGV